MPTDTCRTATRARNFGLRFGAWSLGLFGLLRLSWVELYGVLPITRMQGRLAAHLGGMAVLPVDVTLACSGTDVLALCVGAVLAYPVRWRIRLAGAAGGVALIVVLNTLRIGTLGRIVATRPAWFETAHVFVWPAALILAAAGYVFAWMRVAGRSDEAEPTTPPQLASLDGGRRYLTGSPAQRFVFLMVLCLLIFTAIGPMYLESTRLAVLAAFVARAAASVLGLIDVDAIAAGSILWTARGAFAVTQECVATPLIPVYVAAVLAYSRSWRHLAAGLLATAPVFVALAVARLLLVALPAAIIASPLFVVHAFYQLLLGAVAVLLVALWRHGGRGVRHAVVAIGLGFVVVYVLSGSYERVVTLAAGTALDDPQGAIAFLPAFQIGLFVALWAAAFVAFGWTRFFAGLALLGATQVAVLIAIHLLAGQADVAPHVRDVRGWAVAGPLLVIMAVVNIGSRRR